MKQSTMARLFNRGVGYVDKALQKLGAMMTPAEEQAAKHRAFRRGTYVQAGDGLHQDKWTGHQHHNFIKVRIEGGGWRRILAVTKLRRAMWFKLDKHQTVSRIRENSRRMQQMQHFGVIRMPGIDQSRMKDGVFHSNSKVLPLFTTNVYEGA